MNPDRFRLLQDVLRRRQPDLKILMDEVHKGHNLAAILRSGDAVGIMEAHVVLPAGRLDLHPAVSAGAGKWIRVRRHPDIVTAVHALRASGLSVVAAHPAEDAVDFRDIDYGRPTAILLGGELHGVSEEGLRLADARLNIPMLGMVRSLNVSVAAALVLFEAQRQRQAAGMYEVTRMSPETFAQRLFEWAYPRLAEELHAKGEPYPELDADGEILGR